MRRCDLLSALMLIFFMVTVSSVNAYWPKNGEPIGKADYDQNGEKIVPDGAGGAMAAWTDIRAGLYADVYANRITANGCALGGSGGWPICTASGNQILCGAIQDGSGGMIVVWVDDRDNQKIYSQRIDSTGNILWPIDGINICTAAVSSESDARIISDGAGGAIVAWADARSTTTNDIYAQRIDGGGNLLWGENGVVVSAHPREERSPEMASDGSGGAIIVWMDFRSGQDIYGQRIDGQGNRLWGTHGVLVSAAGDYAPNSYRIISASGGGAFVAWIDFRTGYEDAYAQRIDQGGNRVWGAGGISVCDNGGLNYAKALPQIAEDDSGGVIVAWCDHRSGERYDIFGQRIGSDGTRAWDPLGTLLVSSSLEESFSMTSDDSGGAIVGAALYADAYSWQTNVFAQRVDHDGNLLWGAGGTAVCLADRNQFTTVVIPDGFGGAIIAWRDGRNHACCYTDIYCQHIAPSGLWFFPQPEILSCVDIPKDQGGWVQITTRASLFDVPGVENPILGYSVWRMIQGGVAPPIASASALAASLGLPEGDWESVGSWLATQDTVYRVVVSTKNDSTETGKAEEIYIVTAHFSTAGELLFSAPDTGYSVDNVAPGMTGSFAGSETASPPGLHLVWEPNAAPDIRKYNVYRGNDALFAPGESNLLGSTAGTTLHDGSWVKAYMYFYKLVAVDRHGNPSPAALLRPEDINVGVLLKSFMAVLRQSAIEISWTLAEIDEGTELRAARSTGGDFVELPAAAIERDGLSFSLVDRSIEPGTTYRYQVSAIDARGSRVLFETEEIATPAMPLTLHQNHPNPFNPSTTISYYLPAAAAVTLDVYDTAGRLVTRFFDQENQERGIHSVEWRGVDAQGHAVSSGVYFYRLRCGKDIIARKMILLR